MFYKALIVLTFSALAVNAQSSTATASSAPASSSTPPLSSIPPCVLNCTSTAAAQNGCSSVTDVNCVCTNAGFQQAAGQCLQGCSTSDQQAAAALQSSVCAGVSASGTPSGSGTSASSTAPASSGSASNPASSKPAAVSTSSSAPAKTNAAAGLPAPFSLGIVHVVGLASVALAVVAGGATLF